MNLRPQILSKIAHRYRGTYRFIMKTMYIRAGDVRKNYNISVSTLANWADQGKIRFVRPGRNRYYHKEDIIALCRQRSYNSGQGATICYARVSSSHQQGDLDHHCNNLKTQFPDAEIISEVGSGLNWNRKGVRRLLERIYEGNVAKVVVEYKDTLCRFGFELFEWICEKHGVELLVLNNNASTDEYSSGELSEDLLAIINHSAARGNAQISTAFKTKQPYSREPPKMGIPSEAAEGTVEPLVHNVEPHLRQMHEIGARKEDNFTEALIHANNGQHS